MFWETQTGADFIRQRLNRPEDALNTFICVRQLFILSLASAYYSLTELNGVYK